MYIAMNRFRVRAERAEEFERLWRERDSRLGEVAGFLGFKLARGPESEGVVLYASHSTWVSEDAFRDWTRSEAFRQAHRHAGDHSALYEGPPQFEGFRVVLDQPG